MDPRRVTARPAPPPRSARCLRHASPEDNRAAFRPWRSHGMMEPLFEIADALSDLDDIANISMEFEEPL